MKKYPSSNLRNLALVAHGGAGKTTLSEAMLYTSGTTNRMGKVEEGTTTSDFDPDEHIRKMSILTSLLPFEYQGYKVNLLDTPGYADFIGEVTCALKAVDAAIVVVSGASGVEVQTEKVWNLCEVEKLPRLIYVSLLDKEHTNFYQALKSAKDIFSQTKIVPLAIPVGEVPDFQGLIDLFKMKARLLKDSREEEKDIPAELEAQAQEYREKLIENLAEEDDELLEKYLSEEALSEEELKKALRKGLISGKITPVLLGSAFKNIGTSFLLETIIKFLPSPLRHPLSSEKEVKEKEVKDKENFSALVFKTLTDPYIGKLSFIRAFSGSLNSDSAVFNVTKGKKEKVGHLLMLRGKSQEEIEVVSLGDIAALPKLEVTETGDTLSSEAGASSFKSLDFPKPLFSVAIEPKTRGDEEKLSTSLRKLAEEDPTFEVRRDTETKQTIISGLGDLHLEVMLSKLKRRFGVEATLSSPRIPYKETIKASASAQGKYKKQTGGRGQYGDTWLKLESLERGAGFEFVNKIVGGAIPKNFIPSVEKGVKEAMEKGVLAGYPVVDLRVALYDGTYHPVDSSDLAFKIAGSLAFKQAFLQAKPVLLEPIMTVEVVVPDEYLGDVIGDLSGKRGKVLGQESRGKNQVVKALAPLTGISKYSSELRSLTHGRGSFTMEFSYYQEVPKDLVEKIIAQAQTKPR